MRIIKKSTLRTYAAKYPAARSWIDGWIVIVQAARWKSLSDVRKTYKSADRATVESGNPVVIFDAGQHYRLIVAIHYNTQRVYVRDFLTHESYNSQRWKRNH